MRSAGRILLVEDDPRDVELALEALARHRLANKVDVAHDGQEALDYLHQRKGNVHSAEKLPVVIMLDLGLPRISGLEVLRLVKSDPDLRLIPTVVFTGSREQEDVVRSYDLGTNAYVVKPIDLKDFVLAVADLAAFWALLNEPPPSVLPLFHAS